MRNSLVVMVVLIGCAEPRPEVQTPAATAPATAGEQAESAPTTVFVLGTIHGKHRDSERYSIAVLKEIVDAYAPNYVLTEIPPDRWPAALAEHRAGTVITEPRVSRFPEYTDAIVPAMNTQDFELIPCAAWTEEMATARASKMKQWKTTRPQQTASVNAGFAAAEAAIASMGDSDDPWVIHSDQYDAAVKAGMEPYDRLFGSDLADGGWSSINRAHYALISDALDRIVATRARPQARVLITFGAWHKYWFLEQLRLRSDVHIVELDSFWSPSKP